MTFYPRTLFQKPFDLYNTFELRQDRNVAEVIKQYFLLHARFVVLQMAGKESQRNLLSSPLTFSHYLSICYSLSIFLFKRTNLKM